jgi:hypothetical protein
MNHFCSMCGSVDPLIVIDGFFTCTDCGLCYETDITDANDVLFDPFEEDNVHWGELVDINSRVEYIKTDDIVIGKSIKMTIKSINQKYNTLNYLENILNCIQSKTNYYVPQEVFDTILSKYKKSKVTYTNIRKVLKKNRLGKYYPYIWQIITEINGQHVVFPDELIEDLKIGFKAMTFNWKFIKNTIKKFLPIQFACRNFILYLDQNYVIPYSNSYADYFTNLKRYKRQQNIQTFKELVMYCNFDELFFKYEKRNRCSQTNHCK